MNKQEVNIIKELVIEECELIEFIKTLFDGVTKIKSNSKIHSCYFSYNRKKLVIELKEVD